MWTAIRKPLVAAGLTVVVGIPSVVFFLAALANIWNAISHDTVPHSLTRQGWAMTWPPLWAFAGLVVSVVVMALQAAILREAYKARAVPNPKVSGPDWLLAIPDSDIGNLDTFLYWTQNPMMYTRSHLEATEPYIDLWFGFINASVFTLTFERVEGLSRINGDPLSRKLETVDEYAIPVMQHGAYSQCCFRQWISIPVRDQLFLAHGTTALDASQVKLWFAYTDHCGQRRTISKSVHPDTFQIPSWLSQVNR